MAPVRVRPLQDLLLNVPAWESDKEKARKGEKEGENEQKGGKRD